MITMCGGRQIAILKREKLHSCVNINESFYTYCGKCIIIYHEKIIDFAVHTM